MSYQPRLAVDLVKFRAMWDAGDSTNKIARSLDVSQNWVLLNSKRMGFPARPPRCRRTVCTKGHDLTGPGSVYDDGSCKMCRKLWHAAQPMRTTPKRTVQQDREDTIRTRQMLDLMRQIERCSTHWEREPLQAEFARLQAMSTGGDE